MATIEDVAKRARVSISTVSYALSGKRPVAEATRKRILSVIDELDYHPHVLASGLASRRNRMIGIFFPSETGGLSEGQLDLVLNMTSTATRYRYAVMVWTVTLSPEDIWRLIRENLLEGVILAEVRRDDARVELLKSRGYPFVMLGRCQDNTGLSFVDLDFNQALRKGVDHLADLGHRRITFINSSPELVNNRYNAALSALEGFEQATVEHGISGDTYPCRPTPDSAFHLMKSLLTRDSNITAVITIIDRVIPGVLQAVQAAGRSIPADFSLVGVFSSRIAEMLTPPLTGISSSVDPGKIAIETLVRRLEGEEREPVQVLIPPELVVRLSTGPRQLVLV